MKNLFLIDANSLIHRCFHALPPFTNKEGQATGALYGLSSVLIKILREQQVDYVAVFFDRREPTFRKELFDEYKIHRPVPPNELIFQISEAHNLFDNFGIKTFEAAGFEGDDLIGTAIEKFKNEKNLKITVLTGDNDMLQLTDNEKIFIETFRKGISDTIIYDEKAVEEKYGLKPSQLPDYKGLVGDSSDNIPGVPGIGPKTASVIIKKYKNLENFLENGKEEKSYNKIIQLKDQALLSKKLGTINREAPLELKNLAGLEFKGIPKEKIVPYFEKMGFKSLVNRLNSNNTLFS